MAEIVIAGGGPVGAFLAQALRAAEASVLHVRAESAASDRPIALSYGSRLLLESVGAWPVPSPTPIQRIHVSQQGGFGRTVMTADECALPALGYVAPYARILQWLSANESRDGHTHGRVDGWTASNDGIHVRIEDADGGNRVVSARLLVLADGSHAGEGGRGRDYRQHAIVADVRTERPHRNTAWERFTATGPIALLPFEDRYALVWCVAEAAARPLLDAPETEFLRQLETAFGRRVGRFLTAGPRASFPLVLRRPSPMPDARILAVGNASQTLHPVAGQGLNLGLRDAATLARLVAGARSEDLGGTEFRMRYSAQRRLDRGAGIGITDALVRIFSVSDSASALVRGAGLALMDILPPLRIFLARRMIYGARALP